VNALCGVTIANPASGPAAATEVAGMVATQLNARLIAVNARMIPQVIRLAVMLIFMQSSELAHRQSNDIGDVCFPKIHSVGERLSRRQFQQNGALMRS
jgi:hypothetical protein